MGQVENHYLHTVPLSTREAFSFGLRRRISLLIYHREGTEVAPLVAERPVVIGRVAPADVAIPHSSLSREHARFELTASGEVWVEDLGSTNGTEVAGARISERCQVRPGDEVRLGAVAVSVHELTAADPELRGIDGHDRFLASLEQELVRHRTFGRCLGVILVRSTTGSSDLSRWTPRLRQLVRPVDRVALYAQNSLEIAVVETSSAALCELAEAIVGAGIDDGPALRCGVAIFPDAATSAEALIEAARDALQAQTAAVCVAAETTQRPAARGGDVARGPAMTKVYSDIERLTSAAIPVLICGETGTGKEVVARAIHERGKRSGGPLRCINCAAIPQNLIESTMFGYERGAFTGADRRAKGVFEEADGGTVLLDEIGELSAPAQASLLRVLESKAITRVGASVEIPVDVRILAATHRSLEAMCDAGQFRWDLLYRINTMTLKIPPLRERQDEIEPLARLFIAEANEANDRAIEGLSDAALALLLHYPWHGNVRELRNVIHRGVVLAPGAQITVDDLPERLREFAAPAAPETRATELVVEDVSLDFKTRILRYEAELIRAALAKTGGVQTEAAQLLRMPIRTLAHKIRTLGIDVASAGREPAL